MIELTGLDAWLMLLEFSLIGFIVGYFYRYFEGLKHDKG